MSISAVARALALLAICAALTLAHTGITARRAEGPRDVPPLMTEKEILAKLDRVIEWETIDDPKATLRDHLELASQKHKAFTGVRFAANETAFAIAYGGPRSPFDERVGRVESGRMTSGQLLGVLLSNLQAPSGATFLVRRGHIEITTQQAIREELGAKGPRLPPVVYYLAAKGEKFAALCEKIAIQAEMNIVVDPRVGEKASVAIKATFRNASGPAALEVLADMAGLAVVRRANVYYVTTPQNAQKLASP